MATRLVRYASFLLPSLALALGAPLGARQVGDPGTLLDRVVLDDRVRPFERTIGENDQFGGGLASLGDLNGDGLDEFAIGAPGDYGSRGAVWIFSLTDARTVAKFVKLGPVENLPFELAIGDRFGFAVSSLGDLDGDGVGDVAVGAPGQASGAVYVLFLRANGTIREFSRLDEDTPGLQGQVGALANFGWALAPLGDLDGNGVPDLAVGAPRDEEGKVFLLFFAADRSILGTAEFSWEGTFRTRFGSSLAALGNLDGSGGIDLAVGSRNKQEILFLSTSGAVLSRRTLGTQGEALAAVGDLDADGVMDLASSAEGSVSVSLLRTDGSIKSTRTFSVSGGTQIGFGSSLGAPGDTNANGKLDLVVGAPLDDVRLRNSGGIFFYDLGPDGAASGERRVDAATSGLPVAPSAVHGDDHYGQAIAPLGDLNADGLPEVAVGAPLDSDELNAGAVWIHFLRPGNDGTRVEKFSATQGGLALDPFDRFGSSLAFVGDLDGNGAGDLAVGAPGDNDAGTNSGALWVLRLRANASVLAARKLTRSDLGPDSPAPLGDSLAPIGDLDGDGVTDLALGSTNTGDQRVELVFLLPDGGVKGHVTLHGTAFGAVPFAGFGRYLAWMGRASASGKRYLAVGGSTRLWRLELDSAGNVVDWRARTAVSGGGELRGLAALGDLDGDGLGDVATTRAFDHRISIEFSAADWSVGSTRTFSGGAAPFSLAGLGDLTGDGIPDLAGATDVTSSGALGSRIYLLQLGGIATAGFEHRDNADERPLENGRAIPRPHPGRTFVISSEGANLGATAFDSSPSGPNAGNDLCVDSGMVLLLQDSLAPTQTQGGIFDHPSDDPDGGRFAFDFPRRVRALSLELADLDPFPQEGAQVTLVDVAGRTRLYDVPAGWTGPFGSSAIRRLALDTLAPQPGAGPYPAEAFEGPGFDANHVVRIQVDLFDGGALDDLVYDPYP